MRLPQAGIKGPKAWLIAVTLVWFWSAIFYEYPNLIPLDGAARIRTLTAPSGEPPGPKSWPNVFSDQNLGRETVNAVCNRTAWNKSLVFTCNESYGGVGNIRNSILHCVRFAIQVGASLVLPRIVLRSPTDIGTIETGQTAEFTYMFDQPHFLESMDVYCPQLRIHNTAEDVRDGLDEREILTLSLKPESLVEGGVPRTGIPEPNAWPGQFRAWLNEQIRTASEDTPNLVVVNLQRSYMTYPIYSDGEAFALTFASVLQFRNDTRALANKVLTSLVERFSLDVDLQDDILPNAFFGVHLRTEADSKKAWESAGDYWFYSHYRNQVKVYLEQAPRSSPVAIYVASGDLAETARFAADAANVVPPHNYPVVSKMDLLAGADLDVLHALTFDQQALVDYLVLLKASDFAGVAHSSFAWSIALKRHQFAKKKGEFLDAPEMLDDDLSKVYGTVKDFEDYPQVLWPRI
ncbi:hypothetical protein F5883DRAFT_426123 [Diaporthe sp. PMI_573]|nr:hypothetical protein F5883DRAFT_426123 [Diaporthaceae sp. PMI_573]